MKCEMRNRKTEPHQKKISETHVLLYANEWLEQWWAQVSVPQAPSTTTTHHIALLTKQKAKTETVRPGPAARREKYTKSNCRLMNNKSAKNSVIGDRTWPRPHIGPPMMKLLCTQTSYAAFVAFGIFFTSHHVCQR